MPEFDNPEMRRIQSPEQQEGERRESQQEEPRPPETVESLGKKIAGIDERIGEYGASIEDTNEKLTQARDELGLPPMETDAPSITQSREAVTRLERQKQALSAQREQLSGGEISQEKPKSLKTDPRFQEIWDSTPLNMVPNAINVHENVVENIFRQRYPEDAAAYDAIALEAYKNEQELKQKELQEKEAERAKRSADHQAELEALKAREAELNRQTVTLDQNLVSEFKQGKEAETGAKDVVDQQRRAENEAYLQWMEAHPDAAPEEYFDQKAKADRIDTSIQSREDASKKEGPASDVRFAELRARQAVRLEALKRPDITPEEHQKLLDEYVADIATIYEMKPAGKLQKESKPDDSRSVEKETGIDRANLERNLANLSAEAGLTQSPEIDALKLKVQTASADEAKTLNETLAKAARLYARTRNPDILAQTLMDLGTGGGEKTGSLRSSVENDETRGVYSDLGVAAPDVELDKASKPMETAVPDVAQTLRQETLKRERNSNAIAQFVQSPELFLDRIKDSDADYSPKKGIKVLIDALKSLYPDPSQRAERLQSIYSAYKTTQETYQDKYPEKGGEYAANYAAKQTAYGLPTNEAQQLQRYIREKLDVNRPGGGATRFTPELVMTDFFRYLDSLNE